MGKMSSSDDNSAIFLTDDDATIERKIMTHAFSGGRERGRTRVIQGRFNVSVPRARVTENTSTLRDRSER